MKKIHSSIIILGGGLAGLVSSNILSNLEIDSILFEKNKVLGGGNKSICYNRKHQFDLGYHALDYKRSLIATKFFKKVMGKEYHKNELSRGIILENELFPYNQKLENWPEALQKKISSTNFIDNIVNPTKSKINEIYGKEFSNYIFSDVLNSYPSIKWAIQNGGKKKDFLSIVYPWFFPKFKKTVKRELEWESFHDKVRRSSKQYILYPKSGGFQQFIKHIIINTNKKYSKILTNQKNLKIISNKQKNEIKKIVHGNATYTADLFLWCASPILLLKILGHDLKKFDFGVPQKIIFGNFIFTKPINSNFHEILVGSNKHKINRISFPNLLAKKTNNLIQTEFNFPEGEFSLDMNYWKETWENSLSEIGLVSNENSLKQFSFVEETRGYVTSKNWLNITKNLKNYVTDLELKNIKIPYFNLGPENINRVIPGVITNVINGVKLLKKASLK